MNPCLYYKFVLHYNHFQYYSLRHNPNFLANSSLTLTIHNDEINDKRMKNLFFYYDIWFLAFGWGYFLYLLLCNAFHILNRMKKYICEFRSYRCVHGDYSSFSDFWRLGMVFDHHVFFLITIMLIHLDLKIDLNLSIYTQEQKTIEFSKFWCHSFLTLLTWQINCLLATIPIKHSQRIHAFSNCLMATRSMGDSHTMMGCLLGFLFSLKVA